jgi:dimethylaniline monooxygenase (N-oxide forming)
LVSFLTLTSLEHLTNVNSYSTVSHKGGGKSASEMTIQAKKAGAKSSTMLYREAFWGTPHQIAGIIPFQYIFLSRFGQTLVSLYKGVWPTNESQLLKSSHKILAPVMKPVFGIVEAIFSAQLGHSGDFKPDMDVVKSFYSVPYLVDSEFKKSVKSGVITTKKGEIGSLLPSKISLTNNRGEIPCDVIVCATGFEKNYDMFDSETKTKLDIEKDGLYLYRHTVSPDVENLFFCGSELACIFNVTSYAIQAEWISRVISGELPLPSKQDMKNEIDMFKQWKRSWMPETNARASLALLHHTHFHDTLLKDMKLNPKRKSNILAELLMPYYPKDYDGIVKTVVA